MHVIDCDAHVEESVETWQYLDPEFYLLRPIPVVLPEDTCFGSHNAAWVIDYKLRFFASPTLMKRPEKGCPFRSKSARCKTGGFHTWIAGLDTQVVFPSIWLCCPSPKIELGGAGTAIITHGNAVRGIQGGGFGMSPLSTARPQQAVQNTPGEALGSVAGIYARH
jgi:hypothetical protein